jgi:hypothetical protein
VFAPTWDFTKIRMWKEELLPTTSELSTADLREAGRSRVLDTVATVSSEKLTA